MKRSTLVAAVVLAALGGYIYWFERGPAPVPDENPVFTLAEDSVEEIEIRRRGEETVTLAKKGDSWRLVAPLEAGADATEVDLLLQNLASMKYERVVAKATEVKLADFGLDSPSIEVRFRRSDGVHGGIGFGSDAPTTSNQYARRSDGEEILVLRSHLSLNFDKSAWDVRDKSIFDASASSEPKRIEIERPAGILVLEKERGLWHVTEPSRSRADRYQATSLASRLRGAEMSAVVSESGENGECGDTTRKLAVELEDEASPPLVLEVGEARDGGFCARTPSRQATFLVDASLVADLDRAVGDFQSKKLFDFSSSEVSRFRIERRGETARHVVREGADEEKTWLEDGSELDAGAVDDFLYALNGATAEEVVPREETGAGEPDVTLTVWSRDGAGEEKVRVFRTTGEDAPVLAHREGDSVALRLSAPDWSRIEERIALEPEPEAEEK